MGEAGAAGAAGLFVGAGEPVVGAVPLGEVGLSAIGVAPYQRPTWWLKAQGHNCPRELRLTLEQGSHADFDVTLQVGT